MVLVHFALHPVDRIDSLGGEPPRLGWYALTDGYYWLDLDGVELLRYADARAAPGEPGTSRRPYVDYYVARLWQDLLGLAPTVLDPVPAPLARRLAPAANWRRWTRQVRHWQEAWSDDSEGDLVELATRWWHQRLLETSYVRAAPRIWWWCHDGQVHVRWDTRGQLQRGGPVWAATTGHRVLPVDDFVAELRSFHARLMRAMAERVRAAGAHWPRPDVAVDPAELERAQAQMERWGAARLAALTERQATDWDAVRYAIARLEDRYPVPVGRPTGASEPRAR